MLDFAIILIDDIALKEDIGVIVCGQAQSWITYTSPWTLAMAGPREGWLAQGCAWLYSPRSGLMNKDFKMMATDTSCIGQFELFFDFVLLVYFKICINVLAGLFF